MLEQFDCGEWGDDLAKTAGDTSNSEIDFFRLINV